MSPYMPSSSYLRFLPASPSFSTSGIFSIGVSFCAFGSGISCADFGIVGNSSGTLRELFGAFGGIVLRGSGTLCAVGVARSGMRGMTVGAGWLITIGVCCCSGALRGVSDLRSFGDSTIGRGVRGCAGGTGTYATSGAGECVSVLGSRGCAGAFPR
jgi:hypothetical protein